MEACRSWLRCCHCSIGLECEHSAHLLFRYDSVRDDAYVPASCYFMVQVATTLDVIRFYISAAAMIFVLLAVMLAAYGGGIAIESGVLGAPDAMGIYWKVCTAGHFAAGAFLIINAAVYCLDDAVPARFGAGIPGIRQGAVTALVFWGLWAMAGTYCAYIWSGAY